MCSDNRRLATGAIPATQPWAPMKLPTLRTAFCLLAVFAPSFELLPASAQQAQQPAAASVGVIVAERKPVKRTIDLVGRIEAIERVEVRARITGYLEKVSFQEGALVKAGAPLYSIEKGLFEAAVDQAQGVLNKDKAAKTLSEVQLQRAEELLAKQAGTQVARDQALAADQAAAGALLVDEANLKTAQINLDYTEITSPIAGKIGKTNITKGNVVSPQTGILTTIVSQDPIYVSFPVSVREFLAAQKEGRDVDVVGIKAYVFFSDGTAYSQPGKINFVNVIVDRGTDTILARASFPNPDGVLVDGQLVRVGLESGSAQERLLIPQAALISDQEGIYVLIVEDGKAAVRRVKLGGTSGTGVIVEEGLTGGEQVIVEGIQGIRGGSPVHAQPASTSRS
ncbi:efflux RND transporter periplasmic adaptor subunit [Bradyrhizobium diazoefficiens]|jgi:membrane fusion protein (multidrug efflux system)|uniref:Bll5081 protein n=1 Tax=Bradyrhizobium diazoefficiens (strain JCM 10833 / BCRC 13528 / IAM 13628 / NBRC 14792 / USDA 110) TaxID=224911 RepID=Q89K37_BRADU|nr:efflux RND transporter periplasmic adaptor subunit [Bradyrhizobium diazoefficiens]MBP1064767.1 membrane fusion protein (multidrug efflux system) [Bradyrhizobium japonicum]PDT59649.1 efflux RND transporter periplasmic adaptor subunit [Bradyrhizobium diazoefficiens]QBP23864.1 efflux RND transporter periplasmic adaptor subunit [Bradyrhizobium diazoefficiens]WLB35241.1 efflux RND transporter periplasmic adaptor subunit [Bradyrhizobium diazoefficiens]WLC19763.1 efflux RND transporter periplasmic